MTTSPSRRLGTVAALALLSPLVLAACTADPEPGPVPDGLPASGSRGIDARSYYDDYTSDVVEDSARGALPYAASAGGATRRGGEVPEPGDVPDPDEANTFVDPGASGFVPAAEDDLSTFALDVDDGSLGVARALLVDGYRVPRASVRPEEWVNAMPDDDAAPTAADLGVVAETATAPTLDDGTRLVRVGVSAREVDPADRPRVDVTLVVDTSGSMDIRERLGLVRSSLAVLADRLRDDDTVSVVTFEDRARPVLDPTPISDSETILDAVEELRPGGSTNLEAGLRLGYEQARESFDPGGVNVVVLCSDGVANVGETGPGSIVEKIQEEGADGVHLVTVGFGMGNYNDHLMEQLADLGDGFYSYVDTFGEAERLFGTELTTTLVPVAAEARAQVAFDPERVTSYRLIGYENREVADEDFSDLTVDAGELGSGHHATALYEVRLAPGVRADDVIATASVRWRAVDAGAGVEPVAAGEDDGELAETEILAGDAGAAPSGAFALAAVTADLAQLVEDRPAFADRGVTLDDLAARADALVADDVDGADDLAHLIDSVRDAD